MALIKLSSVIGEIRGKIGGTVFQNSGAGLVVRNLTSPVNRNTLTQNNQRIIISDLQSQWRNLTDCQRTNWNLFIKLFPIRQRNFNRLPINAQQAFIKINTRFRLYGHTIIKDPVLSPNNRPPAIFAPFMNGADLALSSSRAMDNTLEFIQLSMTKVVPVTVNNPGTIYKAMIFATANGALQTISTAWTNVFGILPQVGDKIFFKVRVIDLATGLDGQFQELNVILV